MIERWEEGYQAIQNGLEPEHNPYMNGGNSVTIFPTGKLVGNVLPATLITLNLRKENEHV